MKHINYLNGVLTVIALCLLLITFAVTGILPKATASGNTNLNEKKFISVPLNPDGSLNVKIVNEAMDVNIEKVGGTSIFGTIPVEIKK